MRKIISNLFLSRKTKNSIRPFPIAKAPPPHQTFTKADDLYIQLEAIDKQISETTKNLIEAQTVNLRSYLNRENGFWANIQRERHRNASMKSLKWHWQQLKGLLINRIKIQGELNKITGVYGQNKLQSILRAACLLLLFISFLGLIFMGFMTTLYLLPIWGSILLFFLIYKRNKR